MKFDYVIGNPPYQETQESTSDKPVYHLFIDAAISISKKVELITPARFLKYVGKTPKEWDEKMLSDQHYNVLEYFEKSSIIFPNTDIKGGVAITYYDKDKIIGPIGIYTPYPTMKIILGKVNDRLKSSISDIVYSPESYKFTQLLHNENPNVGKLLSSGHMNDLTSNIFDKLDGIIFYSNKPIDGKEYIQIVGRKDNSRVYMWVRKEYIANHENLNKYKLIFPKSNGSGQFGEVMSKGIVGKPGIGHTQTFISIGSFDTEYEVISLDKYIKSKFARALLGLLKGTQDNKKDVWRFVPREDFSEKSDIDWSKSISEIDFQLYKKYDLSKDEVKFIESNVKEMT